MELKNSSSIALFTLILLIVLPCLISSQTCQKSCGKIPIKYPFGTGPGCGDPRFQRYVTCNNQLLTFATHTGCYPITSIDYNNQVIYINDPSMSTCSCTQPSRGFSLDWNAPFSFHDDTVFALLDCSVTESPIYRSGGGNNSSFPMCDTQGSSLCSMLYSCQAISRLALPISTCCVYTPVDLGPSFEMDLGKLKCTSYSALIGFNGQDFNPQGWKYGIGVRYKFNFNNDYPAMCASCEKSNGVCGYNGPSMEFSCNCPSGYNATTDCSFEATWSPGLRLVPQKLGTFSALLFTWFVISALT